MYVCVCVCRSILVDTQYAKEKKSTQATKTMIWKEVVLYVCMYV